MSRTRRWLRALGWALVPSIFTQVVIDGFSIRPLAILAWLPFWTYWFWYYYTRSASVRGCGWRSGASSR
jgi:hypothetical protein